MTGTGNSAKKFSLSIFKCTELRGFTLSWTSSKIVLDRLGVKVSEQNKKEEGYLIDGLLCLKNVYVNNNVVSERNIAFPLILPPMIKMGYRELWLECIPLFCFFSLSFFIFCFFYFLSNKDD